MTLTATTAEKTVTVELAVPTNLGDLMVTTSPVATRLAAIASEIRIEMKRTVESVIKIGKLLLTAKELTADPQCGYEGRTPDHRFSAWMKAEEFSAFNERVRANFMNVARVYGDRDPADLENIGLSILYELAAPSTPADTRAMIETKFQDGDNLTVKDVKGIVRDARNPSPSISAPAPSQDEDDLPFDPSPDGKATFVPSNTSTPAPTDSAPAVEENEEEEEDVRRTRTRLYATDLITDPEQKMKHALTHMLIKIAGGADFDGGSTKFFIQNYMKKLNAVTVFNSMQSDMMQSLGQGNSLVESISHAELNRECQRAEIIRLVNKAYDDGKALFKERTEAMGSAVKLIPKAFHRSSPVAEAHTAARMALRAMGYDPDTKERTP